VAQLSQFSKPVSFGEASRPARSKENTLGLHQASHGEGQNAISVLHEQRHGQQREEGPDRGLPHTAPLKITVGASQALQGRAKRAMAPLSPAELAHLSPKLEWVGGVGAFRITADPRTLRWTYSESVRQV